MALQDQSADTEDVIEECLDEINDFVTTLHRYPPTAIAVAMSVHLQCILLALLRCRLSTREQVREFVQDFEREVFEDMKS